MAVKDEEYLQILLDAIRVCAHYKPKFGQGPKGGGLTLEQFRELYQGDVLYDWLGLDNPMMYAAHKAAGGMTSIYRQLGIGCEKLFRRVIKDVNGTIRRRRDLVVSNDIVEQKETNALFGRTGST